jgi:hypothetical protein
MTGDFATTTKRRYGLSLIVGLVLYLAVAVGSNVIPSVFLPGELIGFDFAWIGIIQIVFGLFVIALALRIARLRLSDVGLSLTGWRHEALIGAAVAILFTTLQFTVIIPATGGAARSDVATNLAQIGPSVWGVVGFIILAWTGAATEEVFFRGHFLNTLKGTLGNGRVGLIIAAIVTVILFAALHGYQGWAGVIDSGLYGGVTLTLLYLWRRKLTACIVAHALWNSLAAVLLFSLYG